MIGRSGRLMAMGTLFLSGPVYCQLTSSGAHQYVLPMLQRDSVGVTKVVGIWLGAEADAFMREHRPQLKAGRALDLTFEKVFSLNNELHGIVSTCVLAPDRWPARTHPRHTRETQTA